MTPIPIPVPLLNANEPEARLVGVHAQDGQPVQKGDLLFTIETTKAAADVEAPESGFVRMVAHDGDTLAVGQPLAYITASVDAQLPASELPVSPEIGALSDAENGELRITKPARALAEKLGISLSTLPHNRLITEASLRELSRPEKKSGTAP